MRIKKEELKFIVNNFYCLNNNIKTIEKNYFMRKPKENATT